MVSVQPTPAGRTSQAVGRDRGWRSVRTWWRGRFGARLALEVALVGTTIVAYKWARYLVRDQQPAAFENAADVIRLEQVLGIANEEALQDLALRSSRLIVLLNWFYAKAHFWVTLAIAVVVYARAPRVYLWFRRTLVAVTLIALVIHAAFPLAPPRMLHHLGFVDTVAVHGPTIYGDSWLAGLANQYAAMPSLHFGYALLVGWTVCRIGSARWRPVAIAYVGLTLAAVTLTGNHYWIDSIVAALLVLGVGIVCVDQRLSTVIGRRPGAVSRPPLRTS